MWDNPGYKFCLLTFLPFYNWNLNLNYPHPYYTYNKFRTSFPNTWFNCQNAQLFGQLCFFIFKLYQTGRVPTHCQHFAVCHANYYVIFQCMNILSPPLLSVVNATVYSSFPRYTVYYNVGPVKSLKSATLDLNINSYIVNQLWFIS